MTGWQGNEGGYGGGWNPQQNPYGGQQGPDPYGGTPDPYSGQYGGTPGQYGADPYTNPYGPGGTAAYPVYQTGYGPPPPPPPPKRNKLPIVLSIIAIVAVVGTVVTIVLLNRQSDPQPTAGTTTGSSSRPAPTSRSTPPSSRRPAPDSRPPTGGGGDCTKIEATWGTYCVPAGWTKSAEKRPSGLGVDFEGGAVTGEYDCAGNTYWRGFTATGDVQGRGGATLDLNKTVSDFARSFAGTFYNNPEVELPEPKPVTLNGQQAATVTAKLTVQPLKPECDATGGEVAVAGIPVEENEKLIGVRLLVVVNDLAGGPSTPEPLPDEMAEQILQTVTVN